eukprot:11315_1
MTESKEESKTEETKEANQVIKSREEQIDAVKLASNAYYTKSLNEKDSTKHKLLIDIAITSPKHWDNFFTNKLIPTGNEWLFHNRNEQKGQTVLSWLNRIYSIGICPSKKLNKIGLLSIGNLDIKIPLSSLQTVKNNDEKKTELQYISLMDILSKILKIFYGLTVKFINQNKTTQQFLNGIKIHPFQKLKTDNLLKELSTLRNTHKHLFVLVGITLMEIYGGKGYFVFGNALMSKGVGLFSFGNFFENNEKNKNANKLKRVMMKQYLTKSNDNNINIEKDINWPLFIRRCIMVLTHEIGHLFGLKHCPYFNCIMNGSLNLMEADNRPFHLCPICLQKIYYSRFKRFKSNLDMNNKTKPLDIISRYKRLAVVLRKYGLIDDAKWYKERASYIEKELEQMLSQLSDRRCFIETST